MKSLFTTRPGNGAFITMEKILLQIDIYYEAEKFLNRKSPDKLNIVFSMLNLKSQGFIHNTPLLKFGALIQIDLKILIDRIKSVKTDVELMHLSARYKMMAKYEMILPEYAPALISETNKKLSEIYHQENFEEAPLFKYTNLCLN